MSEVLPPSAQVTEPKLKTKQFRRKTPEQFPDPEAVIQNLLHSLLLPTYIVTNMISVEIFLTDFYLESVDQLLL